MRSVITIAVLSLLMTLHPSTASAQETVIEGNWAFKADTRQRCSFDGTMQLSKLSDDSVYTCELIAKQTCRTYQFVVRQSCEVERNDDKLIVLSSIEEFLVGEPTPWYLPDDFALIIQDSENMAGELISGSADFPVKFWRANQGIS